MPRKKRERRMLMPPSIKGMSVTGVRGRKSNQVFILLEEYETIRLLDYQLLNQEQAAVLMQVSRPTLTRIYEEARRKVATAFVEGRDIVFRGGRVSFEENWYLCSDCKNRYPHKNEGKPECPVCGSGESLFLNDTFHTDPE